MIKNFSEYIQILQNANVDINHATPDIPEIEKVVRTLENGKASIDVPSEFFKYAVDSAELLSTFTNFIPSSGRLKIYFPHGNIPS